MSHEQEAITLNCQITQKYISNVGLTASLIIQRHENQTCSSLIFHAEYICQCETKGFCILLDILVLKKMYYLLLLIHSRRCPIRQSSKDRFKLCL